MSSILVCFCELESKECSNSTEKVQLLTDSTNSTIVVDLEENRVRFYFKILTVLQFFNSGLYVHATIK